MSGQLRGGGSVAEEARASPPSRGRAGCLAEGSTRAGLWRWMVDSPGVRAGARRGWARPGCGAGVRRGPVRAGWADLRGICARVHGKGRSALGCGAGRVCLRGSVARVRRRAGRPAIVARGLRCGYPPRVDSRGIVARVVSTRVGFARQCPARVDSPGVAARVGSARAGLGRVRGEGRLARMGRPPGTCGVGVRQGATRRGDGADACGARLRLRLARNRLARVDPCRL